MLRPLKPKNVCEVVGALRNLFGDLDADAFSDDEKQRRANSRWRLERYVTCATSLKFWSAEPSNPAVMYLIAHQNDFLRDIYKARKNRFNQFSRYVEGAWFEAQVAVRGEAFHGPIGFTVIPESNSPWVPKKYRQRIRDEFRVEVLDLERKFVVHHPRTKPHDDPRYITPPDLYEDLVYRRAAEESLACLVFTGCHVSACENYTANKAFLTESEKHVTCKACNRQLKADKAKALRRIMGESEIGWVNGKFTAK